ncbi:phosphonatase-like hydrolase [Pseudofrankia inefficax]|uniref:Haloacid dehalogenase domain protein hydrolase n=1 Tax=Pseudofrankia inefficax (strain DSM 45817 / CECT 9037 / DDB 130130 / EuI1c) TaxID=298654 RepID=E3IZL7_PSEI1|nr:phosphonatase-like hydrolase [Pseudofrankia inefficax]ADP83935.1 Haloacid dehalogenase domain protein hydrolase [Pseudofrankia inefficax]
MATDSVTALVANAPAGAAENLDRIRVDLAVFDIAGTTVEEHGAVYTALRAAVEAAGAHAGLVLADADVERWMGADKRAAIRALLAPAYADTDAAEPDAATVERVFTDFRDRLDAAYRTRPPTPMPGVVEAFGTLRAHGIRIALTTGFDRTVVGPLLASLGWDGGLLDAVVCADDVPSGRPAPYMIFRAMELTGVTAVARVLVAGDTVRDLRAGTNAGAAAVVGVLTGQVSATVLGAVPHTHLLASVADIPALVTGPTG